MQYKAIVSSGAFTSMGEVDRSSRYITATCYTRENRRGTVRNRGIGDSAVWLVRVEIACRFNRATQTRKATPASVWRTRCVIRRLLRALRIAPPATRVHLLWVKRRRGGCTFLPIVFLYTIFLSSILHSRLSVSLSLCLPIPASFSHLFSFTHTLCLMDVQTRLPQHSSACENVVSSRSIVLTSGTFDRAEPEAFLSIV